MSGTTPDLSLTPVSTGSEPVVDVVFLHGLAGNSTATWTASSSTEPEGGFWPSWLRTELGDIRVFVLEYPASLFSKWAKKEMTLFERSKSVLELLVSKGIGTRPVVMVAHSLGGLLAKQILVTAKNSSDPDWSRLLAQTKLVAFIATPHTGASLAGVMNSVFGDAVSPHVKALTNDGGELTQLHQHFRSLAHTGELEVVAYYEKFKTKGLSLVVDEECADPGISGTVPVGIDADHNSICKPASRNSALYPSVVRHIKKCCAGATEPTSIDFLSEVPADRRDLQQKLIDGGREHEYGVANRYQNQFAQQYYRLGLHTPAKQAYDNLLAESEQRFISHVYLEKICKGAAPDEVTQAMQAFVVEPIATKGGRGITVNHKVVLQAVYFLTETCHIRWDAE